MNLHLIAFGAPFSTYNETITRFTSEAHAMNCFKSITILSDNEIFDYDPSMIPHKEFMKNSRAFGFWMWKYFLVSRLMNSIPYDDVILYADVGCTFNVRGINRLQFYYNTTVETGSLLFRVEYPELMYTKRDTYNKIFPSDESYCYTPQNAATAFFLKNNDANKHIVEEIKSVCVDDNYHYITDAPSIFPNDILYRDHRHDQSVLSLISKKYMLHSIPDETYWALGWEELPIWATRLRP
jgi:hypothetical protein